MGNSNLEYNVQIGVQAEDTVECGRFPDQLHDVPTLIPFLASLKGRLSRTFEPNDQVAALLGYEH